MAKHAKSDRELPAIHTVRGKKVVVDADVAKLYGVPTKRLNEAVQRNRNRFPPDFCFHLTNREAAFLRTEIATLDEAAREVSGSHPAILKEQGRGRHRKY